MSEKFTNWGELFRYAIKNKGLVVFESTPEKVMAGWDQYRKDELVLTAPFKISVTDTEKGVLIKIDCACCGKRY